VPPSLLTDLKLNSVFFNILEERMKYF
jgi:hypothetical protein